MNPGLLASGGKPLRTIWDMNLNYLKLHKSPSKKKKAHNFDALEHNPATHKNTR